MRIVSGKHKGHSLRAPQGVNTRPTSDRAREAIFNVLEHGIPGVGLSGARVADIFAGTGALGLEALSRGAAQCVFVENHPGVLRILRDNIQALGKNDAATCVHQNATHLGPPPGGPVNYVFLDAPYTQDLTPVTLQTLADQGWLTDGCVVTVEVAKSAPLVPPIGFVVIKEKIYGAARVVFLTYQTPSTHTIL